MTVMQVLMRSVATGLLVGGVVGAEPVVESPDFEVEAVPLESARVTGHDASMAANLRAVPFVTVSSQGAAVGQSDLSIRGSAFSGAGLTLGGIGLTSPQTEHFNAELPLIADTFALPEVRTGMDQLRAGSGHLAGTVELSLLPLEQRRRLTVGGLERGGLWISGLLQQRLFEGASTSGGAGVFGGYADIPDVDNAGNDVRQASGGARLQLVFPESVLDAVAGYQKKTFGARGYYGVTAEWDAEETLTDQLLFASWRRELAGDGFLRASMARRVLEDDYTLYWTLPGIFNNQHETTVHDVLADGFFHVGGRAHALWRVSGRDDSIRSTNLGDHDRASATAALVPGLTLGRWQVDGGATYAHFESETDRWLPQAALTVHPGPNRVRLAYNQTIREPSYTELNYESPASLGNAGLRNQRNETVELAAQGPVGAWLDWQAAVFHTLSHDTVDWIRETPESARWEAASLGRVRTTGAEAGLRARSENGHQLGLAYTVLRKSANVELHSSRYVLDYPEHHLALSGWIALSLRTALEFRQALVRQASNALRESSSTATPAMLALHVTPGFTDHAQISLTIENLWDDRFEVFPGQRTVTPRRATVGLTLHW